MKESDRDIGRYVDGEMRRDEQIAFEARMRDDATMRRAVEELRGLRSLLAAGRSDSGVRPTGEFRGRVLAAVATAKDERHAADGAIESVARRVVYAAAVVLVAAVLAAVATRGRSSGSGRLEASPAEVQRTMADLDARIRAESVGTTEGR
jgi:anti-sigma-K factor RskA